jgi:two-component system, OmpR family, phosphate regulon response regulator PhoB
MHSDGQAPHILVVNHAPEILDLMRDLLEEEGCRVTTQLRTEQDIDTIAEVAPDLIVIDYMWPNSDNEWTLLNLLRIHRRTGHIPVIVCTAAVAQVGPMQDHLLTVGVRVVLKPFDIDHLVAEVRNALEPATRQQPRPTTAGE